MQVGVFIYHPDRLVMARRHQTETGDKEEFYPDGRERVRLIVDVDAGPTQHIQQGLRTIRRVQRVGAEDDFAGVRWSS